MGQGLHTGTSKGRYRVCYTTSQRHWIMTEQEKRTQRHESRAVTHPKRALGV